MDSASERNMLFDFDRESHEPLYHQLYAQLRHGIRKGILKKGDRLPSIRNMCSDTGMSHITVEKAYLQLAVEGYIRNVPRSGYVVEKIDTDYFTRKSTDNAKAIESIVARWHDTASQSGFVFDSDTRYDFSYSNLAPGSFPIREWERLSKEVYLSVEAHPPTQYPSPWKTTPLQRALASFLQRTRGVSCMPEQIVVCGGSDLAIDTLLKLFDTRAGVVAHEEPGWVVFQTSAKRAGFNLVPLPIDKGPEAYFNTLDLLGPQLVFSTPSHQYPTGMLMQLDWRIELLKRSEERDFYIIEDDACNEYRYDSDAIPSLQSLDKGGRTIYLGTFSKVLSPSLRVSYLVLPPSLLERYINVFSTALPTVPVFVQEILARFIDGGHLDRQIRRMTKANRDRHDRLVKALRFEMPEGLDLHGLQSGMHLFVAVHNGMNQDELVRSAMSQDVIVYKSTHCWFSKPADPNKLIVGFSSIDVNDIEEGVRRLRQAWFN